MKKIDKILELIRQSKVVVNRNWNRKADYLPYDAEEQLRELVKEIQEKEINENSN